MYEMLFLFCYNTKTTPLRSVVFYLYRYYFLFLAAFARALRSRIAFWCYFNEFVVIDPLKSLLQGEDTRWRQANCFIRGARTHVSNVFFLTWVNIHIKFTSVFTNNLTCVHVLVRANEQCTTVLNRVQTIW